MNSFMVSLIFFLAGGSVVGAWWWWIYHKAKAKALIGKVEQKVKGS